VVEERKDTLYLSLEEEKMIPALCLGLEEENHHEIPLVRSVQQDLLSAENHQMH
jgi:hypothetical protein